MNVNGLIDRLTQGKQSFLLIAVTGLLAYLLPYVEATYTTWGLPPVVTGAIGVLLPYAVLWATPLTQQFGYVGKPTPAAPPAS